MQRLHHRAEFADACRAIIGVAGIAAFRRTKVQRVVAPVEAVLRFRRDDGGLWCLARTAAGDFWRHATAFRHCREVEGRQQMHVGQTGFGQGAQMAHAV